MPVRSRGQLLAGFAALLGLWTTGAGCTSSAIRHDAFSVQCKDGSCARKGEGGSTVTTAYPNGAVAKSCNCGSSGSRLQPTPIASSGGGENVSAWQSSQHVNADAAPAESGVTAASGVSLEKPQPLGSLLSLPAGQAQTVPVVNTTTEASAGPPILGALPEAAPPRPIEQPQLGAPRMAAPPPTPRQMKHMEGYPDLPAPVVTHPPAVPGEFRKRALSAYIVEPPDILIIQATQTVTFNALTINGQHLVRPDGTISLGTYGDVFVAGLTLDQIKDAIARMLREQVYKKAPKEEDGVKTKGEKFTLEELRKEIAVDVGVYNSKFYYIITDGGGYGEQVYKLPCTGNETVIDALAAISGIPAQGSKKKIWVARATPTDRHAQPFILPVDWCAIAQRGSAATNYQLFPGDRLYVHSDPLLRLDTRIGRFLSPIDRVFGSILLGSSTVNSIKNSNGGNGNTGIR
jgi:polysaccharide biosynthesis/export protein